MQLPNRLGKMLAPLHWQSYRKQYGRLDEFVSSHKEVFIWFLHIKVLVIKVVSDSFTVKAI